MHVKKALEVLRQHKFFAKASKCAFDQQELEYLGHIVTAQGVKFDDKKIAAMITWIFGFDKLLQEVHAKL